MGSAAVGPVKHGAIEESFWWGGEGAGRGVSACAFSASVDTQRASGKLVPKEGPNATNARHENQHSASSTFLTLRGSIP